MIAVVVINFGSPDLTIRFVKNECVKIQTECVVIVVDNASTDESYTLLTRELPQAHILRCFENQGFARGNNQGAEYAIRHFQPSHILFSNNDIFFRDSDVVDVLVAQMKSRPYVGIIGPQVLGLDGKRQGPSPNQTFAERYLLPTWGKFFYTRKEISRRCQSGFANNAKEGSVGWVSGSCFMVDVLAFEQIGGFDSGTFLYGEEQILSARMSQIGRIVYFYPFVTVIHEEGGVTRSYYDRSQIRRMMLKSESYFFRKYMKTPRWQILLGRFTLWTKIIRGM